jgi:hypothetical protein
MITMEQAVQAKEAVKSLLGCGSDKRPVWLRGVGIGVDTEGSYCIRVYVAFVTPGIKAIIPVKIGSVQVCVQEIGDVIAY